MHGWVDQQPGGNPKITAAADHPEGGRVGGWEGGSWLRARGRVGRQVDGSWEPKDHPEGVSGSCSLKTRSLLAARSD